VNRIYKYEIPGSASITDILLPIGAKILSVQVQGNKFQLWALINTLSDTEVRRIAIFGAGEPVLDVITEFLEDRTL